MRSCLSIRSMNQMIGDVIMAIVKGIQVIGRVTSATKGGGTIVLEGQTVRPQYWSM